MRAIKTHDLTPLSMSQLSQTELLWRELHETLEYNPETGKWKWLKQTSSKSLKGSRAGSVRTNFSRAKPVSRYFVCFKSKIYLGSRLAWFYMTGEWPQYTIDHIDRDSLNDRWNNLRDVTYLENNQNRSNTRRVL